MNLWKAYWDFIVRPVPADKAVPYLITFPRFYEYVVYYAIFFSAFTFSAPFIMKTLWPTWYNSLPEVKKKELPPYINSCVHHFVIVGYSWWWIYHDALTPDSNLNWAEFVKFGPVWVGGYILGDTFSYAIPIMFKGNFEYIIHHILSGWMFVTIVNGPGMLVRYFPHIGITETGNICFNLAWILRTTSWKGGKVVTFLEFAFAILFLVLRVFNLSVVFWIMFFSEEGVSYGVGKYVFPLISGLQFFWMFKIVQSMFKRKPGGGGDEKKETKDK